MNIQFEKNIIKRNELVFWSRYKQYIILALLVVTSYVLFALAEIFAELFSKIMSVASYLTWHNLFEFSGILVCFSSFVVSYYTYDQSKRFRSLLLGCFFLFMGIVDAFHTLSFKGMPDFFIANAGANRATTFWIISRLVGGIGFATAGFINVKRQYSIQCNKKYLLLPSIILSFMVLVVVTYFPSVLPAMYVEGKGLTPAKIYCEYTIIALLLLATLRYIMEYEKTRDFPMLLMSGAMLLNVFSELAFVSYQSVYDIYNYLGHVYKALSFFMIFRVIFIFNVQKPYRELTQAQTELRNYADNLDRLVDQRTREIKAINQKLLDDLEYACDIQKSMLPTVLPDPGNVVFSARYFPAERVSGDFYNVFMLDEENVGLYVGDVSGHGVSAAMLTVFVNQNIKTMRESETGEVEILSPSVVLKNLHKSFSKTNFKDEIYFILYYAVYNTKTRKLTYASAGMNAIPLIIGASGDIAEIDIKGLPIFKFTELYPVEYKDSTVLLREGDKVLFYTDGLVESYDGKGQCFTEQQLVELLKRNCHKPGIVLSEIITREFVDLINMNSLKDDVTFLIMEVK
jgi:phosphoserine phosphatase RsbU/P